MALYKCVYYYYYYYYSASISKLVTDMFQDETWKHIYFEVKRSKVNVMSHDNIAGVGLCTLVNAGFF